MLSTSRKKTNLFKSYKTGKTCKIFYQLTCKSQAIYLRQCRIFFVQYVGKSEIAFNLRLNNHRKDSKKEDVILGYTNFQNPNFPKPISKTLLFERREKVKTVSQPAKRQKEEPEHHTIVINTPGSSGDSSTLAQETLEVPAFNNKSKVVLKLKEKKSSFKTKEFKQQKGKIRITQKFLNKMSQRKRYTARIIYIHRTIY